VRDGDSDDDFEGADHDSSEGTRVEFVPGERGEYRMVAKTYSIKDLAGFLYDPNRKTVTIEEMNETIAQMGSDSL
jgi:hypothetical protein